MILFYIRFSKNIKKKMVISYIYPGTSSGYFCVKYSHSIGGPGSLFYVRKTDDKIEKLPPE